MELNHLELALITNALTKELVAIAANENLSDFMRQYKTEHIEKLLNKINNIKQN